MAKTPKSDRITAMTISDLADMDIITFNTLTADELRQVNRRLTEQARKKVKWVEKSGNVSLMDTAFKRMQARRSDNMARGKRMTIYQLRSQYSEVRNLFQYDRSREAVRLHTNRVIEGLAAQGVHVSAKNLRSFFETVEKLEQMFPELGKLVAEGKYQEMQTIAEVYRDRKIKDKVAYLTEMYNRKLGHRDDVGTSRNPLKLSSQQFRPVEEKQPTRSTSRSSKTSGTTRSKTRSPDQRQASAANAKKSKNGSKKTTRKPRSKK